MNTSEERRFPKTSVQLANQRPEGPSRPEKAGEEKYTEMRREERYDG